MTADELLQRYAEGRRDFRGVLLPGADLRAAELPDVDFRGADLTGANLERANLCGADLSQACLGRAQLTAAQFRRARLAWADLRDAVAHQADLREATVITMWLWPEMQRLLRSVILQQARPGTRVVTNLWDMGSWPSDDQDLELVLGELGPGPGALLRTERGDCGHSDTSDGKGSWSR